MQIYKWVPARVEDQHEKQLPDSKQAVQQQNGSDQINELNGIQISLSESRQEKVAVATDSVQQNGTSENGSSLGSNPDQATSNISNSTNNNSNDKLINDDPPSNNTELNNGRQLSSLDRKTPDMRSCTPTDQRDAEVTEPQDDGREVARMPTGDDNQQTADKDGAVSKLKSCEVESMDVDEEAKVVSNQATTTTTNLEALDTAQGGQDKDEAEKVGQVEPESTTATNTAKDCKAEE